MYGEAKAYTFVVGKRVSALSLHLFRNEEYSFAGGFCQLLGCPPCISGAREIEYHVAKLQQRIEKQEDVSSLLYNKWKQTYAFIMVFI